MQLNLLVINDVLFYYLPHLYNLRIFSKSRSDKVFETQACLRTTPGFFGIMDGSSGDLENALPG